MAFYGWPVSQCQSLDTPLSAQLESGIRVLDIRLSVIGNELVAYHGDVSQKAKFKEILAILCGVIWGLWIGFAITAAGTFLGEIGNF